MSHNPDFKKPAFGQDLQPVSMVKKVFYTFLRYNHKKTKGLTYLEMIISIGIWVLVAVAISTIFNRALIVFRVTTDKNEAIQQAGIAGEWLVDDIQKGYAILKAEANNITLVDSNLDYINYFWNSTNQTITRKVCAGQSYLLAEGVSQFSLKYYGIDNQVLATPTNPLLSLKTVEIDMTTEKNSESFRFNTVAGFDFKPGYQWARTYGGTGRDFLNALQNTTDEGYIYGGNTTSFGSGGDFLVIKTDANADVVWAKAYGDANDDALYSLLEVSTGYLLGGYTASNRGLGSNDFLLINTTSSGALSWAKVYGSSQSDTLFSLIKDNSGAYVLGGVSNGAYAGTGTRQKALLIKAGTDGTVSSAWAYNNTTSDIWLYSVIEADANDGYVFVGSCNNQGLVVKTQTNGVIGWEKRYTNVQEFRSISDVSGGYVVGGRSSTGLNVLTKIENTTGNPQWGKTYTDVGTKANCINAIEQSFNETGIFDGYILGSFNTTSASDFLVIKANTTGEVGPTATGTWVKTYSCTGAVVDRLMALKRISDGYLLGGVITNSTTGTQDFRVIKTDISGGLNCCNSDQDKTSLITVSAYTVNSDTGSDPTLFIDITGDANFKNATFTVNITASNANANVEYTCPSP